MFTAQVIWNLPGELSKPVSRHFAGSEFRCKCGKCQITIIATHLLDLLDHAADAFGRPLHISSGYRCQEHNRSLSPKSSPHSWHMSGCAADVVMPDSAERKGELVGILRNLFPYIQVGDGYIHCDIRGKD